MAGSNPIVLTVTDDNPDATVTLMNANGVQDLTGCTIQLRLKNQKTTVVTTYTATPNPDPTDGVVTVVRSLLAGVSAGLYAAEYLVTFVDFTQGTFPTPEQFPLDFLFVARRT